MISDIPAPHAGYVDTVSRSHSSKRHKPTNQRRQILQHSKSQHKHNDQSKALVWLIGAVVCLLAANCGFHCLLMRAMDGCIVRCGIISSCQSAVTAEIVKHFWSRV